MVHALKETHRLLTPDGILVDIHPSATGTFVQVFYQGEMLLNIPKREQDSTAIPQAEAAIKDMISAGLFVEEGRQEFDYCIYASSMNALRTYWDEQSEYETPRDPAVVAREAYVFAQAESLVEKIGPDAQLVLYDRATVSRLRPVQQRGRQT